MVKDLGQKYYTPRIKAERFQEEHRERFRNLGKYFLDGEPTRIPKDVYHDEVMSTIS